jgi:LPPG:FO 2-phospho-L-lactate transferase
MEKIMKIVALAGGVGGAKLADGLARVLSPGELTIIVNTGDDFEHWGLKICPDLDTVCYTLAGLANPETGWGRKDETWKAFEAIQRLGGADWFRIGDLDLGTHIERTLRLNKGQNLSQITRDFCKEWGIKACVLPMSDEPVATIVNTIEHGEMAFQEYFVHQQCSPQVKGFHFDGVERSVPAPGVMEAISAADAIIICPSNPWVSIDPILAVPGIRSALERPQNQSKEGKYRPVIAISPIIAGQTVKGPAAKMFAELGIMPSARAVAEHYSSVLTGFILDTSDEILQQEISKMNIKNLVTNSLMKTVEDRQRLALDVLHFIESSI